MSEKYTTTEQIVSYGLGRQFGDQLSNDPFDGIDANAIAAGLLDAMQGKASPISDQAFQQAFQEINELMQAKDAEKAKMAAEVGEKFLVENAKRSDVIVLNSGLQYEIIEEGKGQHPAADSTVQVHYHGTLVDGTVFDSSVERGQPAEFPVNRVIAGWTEALQLMPAGSKWRLYIPHDLAYGAQGSGRIAPYSALIFDVELLAITR